MTAVIRPRRPWEAIDLGFSLVRAWWRPLAASWFLSTFPLWLVLSVALYRWPAWAMVAFWWLKPVWDRVPLLVLSRALFGAVPSRREVLGALPRLWRGHLVSALTLYRLDPARSFNLPVWQLEGLRGAERWNRARILQQDTRGTAVWLTIACIVFEAGTTLALYGLFSLLLPYTDLAEVMQLGEPLKSGWAGFALSLLQTGTSYLAVSLIEPFYMAAGFSLYLSRRTHLEGWDVELAFRRLARRLHEPGPTSAGSEASPAPRRAALVLAFLLLGTGWLAPAVLAQEESAVAGTGLAEEAAEEYYEEAVEVPVMPPRDAVREVLAQPEFQTKKKVTRWKLKYELPDFDWFDDDEPSRAGSGLSLPFLRVLAYGVAFLGAAALLIILARWGFRHFGPVHLGRERPPVPETLFGLDIRPESLPEDIPAAAWALWEQGEAAQALGLLYRGALTRLVQREGAPVRASWTEGDCLRFVVQAAEAGPDGIAEPAGKSRADYFTRLTRAWQSTAYAHRPPDRAAAESLVRHWSQHFGAAA
ncbi:MAG TPA: DUF4129 domain-containing protein [Thermoanaerobaculia bacterium]|nr:DUF4129 domain-containing protein [Thermoanaerobaculia bacterium]